MNGPAPTPRIWAESELAPLATHLGITVDEFIDHCQRLAAFTGKPILHVVGEAPDRLIEMDQGLVAFVHQRVDDPTDIRATEVEIRKYTAPPAVDFSIDRDGTITQYVRPPDDDPLKRDY